MSVAQFTLLKIPEVKFGELTLHSAQCSVEAGEEREPPPTVVRGQWSLPLPLVRGKRKRKRKV